MERVVEHQGLKPGEWKSAGTSNWRVPGDQHAARVMPQRSRLATLNQGHALAGYLERMTRIQRNCQRAQTWMRDLGYSGEIWNAFPREKT